MSCNQPKSPKLNTLSNTKQEAVAIINNKKSKMGNKLMHDGERTKNDETDNKPGKGGVEPHYRTKAQAISNDEEIAARERSHVSCSPASLNPGNNGQRNKISEEAKQKRILLDLNQEVQLQVDGYGIFSNPVEDKGPHIDYYDVVDREQEAMDFGTMGKLIKDGNIATINDFERYLRRIVNSTRKYNSDKNSFTRLQADQIELRAHPIVNVAREKWSTLTSEVRQEDFTGNIDEDRSTKDSMINTYLSYAIDSDSDTSSHDYGNTSDSAESQDDFNDREVSTRTLRSFSPDIKTSSLENTTSEENKLSREKRSRIRNALMDKDENITIPRRVRIPRKVKSLSQKKQGSTRNKDSCAMERRKEGNRAQPTRYPIRSNRKRKAPGYLPIENSPSLKSSSETENTDNGKEIHSYSRSRRKQNNNEDDIHKRRTKRSRYTQVVRKKQSKCIDKGSSDENSDNRDTSKSKENHRVKRKKSSRWENKYQLLRKFYNREGHCKVPQHHMEDRTKLGSWLNMQRKSKKKGNMNADRKTRLDELGIVWDVEIDKWERKYQLLRKFYNRERHCKVPRRHVEDGTKLGPWLSIQRLSKKNETMNNERETRLNQLGMVWDVEVDQWESKFQKLFRFQKRKGHCNVPFVHEEDGIKLGSWLCRQRASMRKGNINALRKSRLDKLGIVWEL